MGKHDFMFKKLQHQISNLIQCRIDVAEQTNEVAISTELGYIRKEVLGVLGEAAETHIVFPKTGIYRIKYNLLAKGEAPKTHTKDVNIAELILFIHSLNIEILRIEMVKFPTEVVLGVPGQQPDKEVNTPDV